MKKNKPLSNSTSERPQATDRRKRFRDLVKQIALAGAALCFVLLIVPASWRFVYFSTTMFLIVFGAGVRVMQILYPGRYEFTEFLRGMVRQYESLDRRHQLYLNVTLCLPFLGYLYVLGAYDLFVPVAILFFIYCLGVVTHDVYRIYAILYETSIGKGLIAIAFAIGSNLAFSISGKVIGEMAHVPPTTFPHTLSFLAIFAIPFLFIAAGTVFIPIAAAMAPLLIYGSSFAAKAPRFVKWFFGIEFDGAKNRYIVATLIFQMVFYLAIGTFTPAAFLFLINRYDHQIDLAIGRSIYEFDMYSGTECTTDFNYRQASLGDENYILASEKSTGITFEKPKKCPL